MNCKKGGKESREKTVSPLFSTPGILFMSVSPFSQEVRARAKAYSFLYFEHIAQGLAVGGCLSHITDQIERMSGKGRMPSCVGLEKHV